MVIHIFFKRIHQKSQRDAVHSARRLDDVRKQMLIGCLIEVRLLENGILVLRVVDALCRSEHQSALLSAVVLAGKERGAAIVDFFCSLDSLRPALGAAGFFDEAEHPDGRVAALFQPLDFRKTAIRVLAACPGWREGRLEDWYITKADSDQDRPNDRRAIKETVR